jgi:hypothetical protein
MGIDLKVLASHFRERQGEVLATASLRLERDPRLLAQLARDAEPNLTHRLPTGLKVGHHEDEGLLWSETDRYGAPLTCTTPESLQRLRLPEDPGDWNQAVIFWTNADRDGLLEAPLDEGYNRAGADTTSGVGRRLGLVGVVGQVRLCFAFSCVSVRASRRLSGGSARAPEENPPRNIHQGPRRRGIGPGSRRFLPA